MALAGERQLTLQEVLCAKASLSETKREMQTPEKTDPPAKLQLHRLPTPARSWLKRQIPAQPTRSSIQETPQKPDLQLEALAAAPPTEYTWSAWRPVPGRAMMVFHCDSDEALGLCTDPGPDESVYVEAVQPGSWAAKICLPVPSRLVAVNGNNVRTLPSQVLNTMMRQRPLKLGFVELEKADEKQIDRHNGAEFDCDRLTASGGLPIKWALDVPLPVTSRPVPFEIVIPTYKRWQLTQDIIGKEKKRREQFAGSNRAFILDHTLSFLHEQGIHHSIVTLFVADTVEAESYKQALKGSPWEAVNIRVSAPGIRDSRNAIMKSFSEGTYVVSLDDDLECILCKARGGNGENCALTPMAPGEFLKLIFDAYHRMRACGAHLWGLSTSRNPLSMNSNWISVRNGLVNGYLHGFICRPNCSDLLRSLTDAVEDCEFSVRHFNKDGIVLRYTMFAGMTCCYANAGGLQASYEEMPSSRKKRRVDAVATGEEHSKRKTDELKGGLQLHRLFPRLIAEPASACSEATMSVKFRSCASVKSAARSRGISKFARASSQKCSKREEHRLQADRRIQFKQINPKRIGTKSYARYEKYMHAKTVHEAKNLGATPEDFANDITKGFCTVFKPQCPKK